MTKKTKSQVNEDTLAADSLHPAARAVDDPKSRFDTIVSAIGKMYSMRDDELTKWYDQSLASVSNLGGGVKDGSYSQNSDTLNMKPSDAVGGHEPHTCDPMPTLDSKGTQSGADKLGATLPNSQMPMPKISVKEDVDALFEGQNLSEEFKNNASMLFEAAVTARVILETEKLDHEYGQKLDEAIESVTQDLSEKLDAYLDYTVSEWMTENEVAIEGALRNEISESFIAGLRALFLEHSMTIPEENVSVVEQLTDELTTVQEELGALISENNEMRDYILAKARVDTVEQALHGLTETQKDKFRKLAEGVEFDGDVDTLTEKLKAVRENFFKSAPGKTNLEEETFTGDEKRVAIDPDVSAYITAMDRTLKR